MLSVILPTYNEADNLPDLILEIEHALKGIPYEVIVVDDDSPDRTWEVAENLGNYVRVLRRIGRRGLSSAAMEGADLAEGDIIAVMDSDGQHDPKLLPLLYKAVKAGNAVAIGSRYIPGGSVEGWAQARHFQSRVATALAWLVSSVRVSDPMSGFFAIDKKVFQQISKNLHPRGFKILLEVLSYLPRGAKTAEVPLVFRLRRSGESKLNATVQMEFLQQVLTLFFLRWQWKIFIAICVLIFVCILPVLWNLRLLYLDSGIRNNLQGELETMADERGFLLSDLSILSISDEVALVLHRAHIRGEDPEECFFLTVERSTPTPCDDL